jgi:hypothetical protein
MNGSVFIYEITLDLITLTYVQLGTTSRHTFMSRAVVMLCKKER